MKITGYDILGLGIPGGTYFPEFLCVANSMIETHSREEVLSHVKELYQKWQDENRIKTLSLQDKVSVKVNIEAETEEEEQNLAASLASMTEAAKTPTVRAATILPDACPSGPMGTITVGGVIATENAIHPGMHSADICCSMALTDLGNADPNAVWESVTRRVKFGPFAKNNGNLKLPSSLLSRFKNNRFMSNQKILFKAEEQLGTQGDGNHFYFVGISEKTGHTCIVSHHGSRAVGGTLYSLGMKEAVAFTSKYSPETLKGNSWIEANSQIGQDYWEALQLARNWTKLNHLMVHDLITSDVGASVHDRFWNEHNFVFKRNGLYYHAKGATPAWHDFSDDVDVNGRTIIPLNMSQPVLIVKGSDNPNSLGFSPHGAGRNMSRTQHMLKLAGKTVEEVMAEDTKGIKVMFQSGKADLSELPSAYKNATAVASQIERLGLAKVQDRILPFGSVMAGEIELPWKKK